MGRPYIVCHMLQSIDGKISGNFFNFESTLNLSMIYQQMAKAYKGNAIIYGSVTLVKRYGDSKTLDLESFSKETVEKKDYIHHGLEKSWVIAIDPYGDIGWSDEVLKDNRLKNKAVITVVSDSVSDEYLAYLQSLNISYLIGGQVNNFNLKEIVKKLKDKFGIEKIMLQGGGIVNGTFLSADLIDEISLIIAPIVGGDQTATLFGNGEYLKAEISPVKYSLTKSEPLTDSGIWLNYHKRK